MKILYFFSLLFIFNLSLPLQAQLDHVTWTRWNDPPIFVQDPPFKGFGMLDKMEEEMKKQLPQYKHEVEWVNVLRVLQLAKELQETCNAGWLDTPEWREVFYLSKPSFLIPANGILIKEQLLPKAEKLQPYSLKTFLEIKDWRMAVGRLYGEGIDPYLQKINYQKHPQIDVVQNSAVAHRMLQLGRVDYTLGYPFEAFYYQQLMKQDKELSGKIQEKIIHLPVTENANYVEVVFACAKTAQGKRLIEQINKLLANKKRLKLFESYLDRWLSADEIKKLEKPRLEFYRKHYPKLK